MASASLHQKSDVALPQPRISAATADRLLRSQRNHGQGGLSTTRAGTLLKQQIPIRTFAEWNEIRPGFLEADLVAPCGTDIEGVPVHDFRSPK